jgi:hypothetical protein
MATIDSKSFIDQLIAGHGRIDPEDAPDNPWVDKIVEYTNYEGGTCWGIVFETDRGAMRDRYEVETAYVRNPRVIWRRQVVRP